MATRVFAGWREGFDGASLYSSLHTDQRHGYMQRCLNFEAGIPAGGAACFLGFWRGPRQDRYIPYAAIAGGVHDVGGLSTVMNTTELSVGTTLYSIHLILWFELNAQKFPQASFREASDRGGIQTFWPSTMSELWDSCIAVLRISYPYHTLCLYHQSEIVRGEQWGSKRDR